MRIPYDVCISARRGLWVRPVRMLPAKGAGACRWHHYTCFARECKAWGNPCRMEVHQKCRRADECAPAGPSRKSVPKTDRRAVRPGPQGRQHTIRREPTRTRRSPRAARRGSSTSACQSYPASPSPGRVVFRYAGTYSYTRERPGGGLGSPTSERVPKSKKWPEGHFFDASAYCALTSFQSVVSPT